MDVIRDLFHERCSFLYHDIIDTIRHGDHDETNSEVITVIILHGCIVLHGETDDM